MRYIDPSANKEIASDSDQKIIIDPTRRRRRKKVKKLATFLSVFLIAVFIFIFTPPAYRIAKRIFTTPRVIFSIVFDVDPLKKTEGRTNVLLLGIGGPNHQGGELSDSIVVASLDKKKKDVALISLPRDIWIDSTQSKINAIYSYGEENGGNGLEDGKKTISEVVGLPIHYAIRLDFSGFEQAIDQIEGIDVNVDKGFDDYKYPIPGKEKDNCGYQEKEIENEQGQKQIITVDQNDQSISAGADPFVCRFEYLHFEAGLNHFDGKTALKYVRSRMGTNNEGSDFARAARQQKVISAFYQKAISYQTILDPDKIVRLASTFDRSLDTDLDTEDIIAFVRLAQGLKDVQIRNFVPDTKGENSLLINPSSEQYAGAYVLIPRNGWSSIHQKIKEFVFGAI